MIDNQVNYAQTLIDDFYVADKPPHIAVSVDMMDTGIDVAEIVNLVFFKLVRSKTKFWQMVGRGTRLCPNLFGPDQDKQFFYLFDYCQNLEFFGERPDGIEAPVQESVKTKVFKRRVALVDHLQDHGQQPAESESAKEFAKKTAGGLCDDYRDQLCEIVKRMDVDNFIVRRKRRQVEKYQERKSWDRLTTADVADVTELAPLPYPDEDDEFARRFDLLVLNLELAILDHDPKLPRYQERIRELAAGLEQKQSIPLVSAQLELILEVQSCSSRRSPINTTRAWWVCWGRMPSAWWGLLKGSTRTPRWRRAPERSGSSAMSENGTALPFAITADLAARSRPS